MSVPGDVTPRPDDAAGVARRIGRGLLVLWRMHRRYDRFDAFLGGMLFGWGVLLGLVVGVMEALK